MSNQKNLNCEFLLTPGDQKELAEFARFLRSGAAPAKLILQNGEKTIISQSIYQLLQNISQAMESGKSVSLSPQFSSGYKVSLQDLMESKKQQYETREKLLDEIMEISQETGFYE